MTRARKLWAVLALCLPLIAVADGPRVVASIKPVHALVAGVMQGMGTPHLLIPASASPHDYSLRPSDVRSINDAQVVFWIGPNLERFLVKSLAGAPEIRSVELLEAPGVTALAMREGGAWESHKYAHAHDGDEEGHHHHGDGDADPHVWLDPRNAIAMVRAIGAVLSEADPAHRADYERNSLELIERLERLDQALAAELAPVKDIPYVVFHDAYQYFERRYGLNAVGSIVVNPEQRPGARRIQEIRNRIRADQARCVFSEPQFESALVGTLVEGTGARRGVLDPEGGADLPAGPEAYFQLMHKLAASLRSCLGAVA